MGSSRPTWDEITYYDVPGVKRYVRTALFKVPNLRYIKLVRELHNKFNVPWNTAQKMLIQMHQEGLITIKENIEKHGERQRHTVVWSGPRSVRKKQNAQRQESM